MKLKAFLFSILIFTGCATQQSEREPEEAANGGRTFAVDVDASSRTPEKQGFVVALEGQPNPSLFESEGLRQVERALIIDGFPKDPGTKPMEIKVSFERQNPITGAAIFGRLLPYKHTVHLRAIADNEIKWEVIATGASEEEDIRPTLPYLLTASLGLIGKSTSGKVERSVPEASAKAARIKAESGAEKKKGLLEQ